MSLTHSLTSMWGGGLRYFVGTSPPYKCGHVLNSRTLLPPNSLASSVRSFLTDSVSQSPPTKPTLVGGGWVGWATGGGMNPLKGNSPDSNNLCGRVIWVTLFCSSSPRYKTSFIKLVLLHSQICSKPSTKCTSLL